MVVLSASLLVFISVPLVYFICIAIAATRSATSVQLDGRDPSHRFAITIPAHNEAAVIQETIRLIFAIDYPEDLYEVHIVADHCSDNTAEIARESGARVHERKTCTRGGKGEALSWLFSRILDSDEIDAVIVFDADTRVHHNFLRVMDFHLAQGDQVIQGQHVISNPDNGWFPALTWAMLLVDNRFQNLGRSNLGLSAKNMGDSICIRAEILRKLGWGSGLTEDYEFRKKLVFEGGQIVYEPSALGFGEAPRSWAQARAQRTRWLRGTYDVSLERGPKLLLAGIKACNPVLLDGAIQMFIPSYSTITMLAMFLLAGQVLIQFLIYPIFPKYLLGGWTVVSVVLFLYPFWGLILEQAPLKAFLVMLSGPFYIVWRTWLAISVRYSNQPIIWKRTSHEGQNSSK